MKKTLFVPAVAGASAPDLKVLGDTISSTFVMKANGAAGKTAEKSENIKELSYRES